jgi:formylmethanofuran dehydrogenase subunit E
MKAENPKVNANLAKLIEKAADLHGHLGPFLVIGVRIGKTAKKVLGVKGNFKLQAEAKVPLLTPFSCVLDGIQAITNCTIGNQKLRVKNSKKIAVSFTLDSDEAIRISVKPEIVKKLMNRISDGSSNEELAREIARMPEDQLFTVEKQ